MTSKKPHPLPPAIFIGITIVILVIVITSVWRNTLHRPDIRGDWTSAGCELLESAAGDKASMKQRLQLTRNEWAMEQTYFSDSTCNKKAYSLQTVGVYELGDKSTEVEGATHGEFIRRELHLTAFSMESAQIFEQYRCGNTKWETDVTTIVNTTGCTGITPSIDACPSEFDVIKRDADKLYFGDRSESLCERGEWPKTLNPVALKKSN